MAPLNPVSHQVYVFGSPRISLTKATDGIDSTPAFTVHLRSQAVLSAGGRARICRPTALIGFAVVSKSYEATAKICQVQLYENEFPGVLSSRSWTRCLEPRGTIEFNVSVLLSTDHIKPLRWPFFRKGAGQG